MRNIIMTLFVVLRSHRVGHCSWCNRFVTLVVWCQSPVTNLAALRCTISKLWMLFAVFGSQMMLAYSICGLTRVLQHSSLVFRGHCDIFLCRKALVVLAFRLGLCEQSSSVCSGCWTPDILHIILPLRPWMIYDSLIGFLLLVM